MSTNKHCIGCKEPTPPVEIPAPADCEGEPCEEAVRVECLRVDDALEIDEAVLAKILSAINSDVTLRAQIRAAVCLVCAAVTNPLNVAGVDPATQRDLSWTLVALAVTYDIRYRPTVLGGLWTSGGSTTAPDVTQTISGLTTATKYSWQVRAVCGDCSVGEWIDGADFTTS